MGSSEGIDTPKPEKASPSKQDLKMVYPFALAGTIKHSSLSQLEILFNNLICFQSYYAPEIPIPPSYLNSAIMAGHAPHHDAWAQPQTAPVSTQLFLSESMDEGITKMLDRLDRVDMQIVEGTHEVDGEGSINGASQSAEGDASSNRSDSHTSQSQGESTSMGKQNADSDVEVNTQANSTAEGDANVASIDLTGITVAPEKPVDTSNGKSETGITRSASFAVAGLPLKASLQEQKQLKREKRKQANRESACRSRLKKQALDELMKRYETVKVENTALKSEINQLTEEVEKLKAENCALMEKLNGTEVTHPREMVLDETRPDSSTQPNCSEDGFILNNSVSFVIGIN
ncbi:hypothetical protein RHGRI_019952 [Rhododendron griersonianum]|uniref:BZIP domain-containing protein n=1 Tax=Rhododendron griersonianum TaxID=479676 RepID=A0AAV6JEI6_9ERIC|nr:hypothetical protein RHGRI_019952 [Rhododendron griersonianum]